LKEKKIIQKMPMGREGRNDNNENYRDFYYKNKDSIFLVGIYDRKFYHINDQGEILNSYPLSIKSPEVVMGQPYVLMGLSDAQYHPEKNQMWFPAFPLDGPVQHTVDDPIFWGL